MGNREVPHAFEKKGARRRTVLAGPRFDIVTVSGALDPLYGYIFLSRLNGIRDVPDASIG
jgi:hypothetical protein